MISNSMDSADAPKLWKKMGQYDEVVEYCMKDTQLVYDLFGNMDKIMGL